MADPTSGMTLPGQPPSGMPPLPQFNFQSPGIGNDPGASDIFRLLSQQGQSMTNMALPAVQNALSQQNQFLMPAIHGIQAQGQEAKAGAQSDAMKRGLTGSDIEAAGMRGVDINTQNQVGQLQGQMGMQQAHTMAASIMQAMGMDIQTQQGMFQNLAQAIGQHLSQQQSLQMFQQQMELQKQIADQQQNSNLWKSILGAVGGIGGSFLGGPAGGALGAKLFGAAADEG